MTDEQAIETLKQFNSQFPTNYEPQPDPEFQQEYAKLTLPRQEWLKLIAFEAVTLEQAITARDHQTVSALINSSEAPGFHHPSCFVS